MDFTQYYPRLSKFTKTPQIAVIHHTADMADFDIQYYNKVHQERGFICFGAHALCRWANDAQTGMAMLQEGRPPEYVGAHAFGINSISLGVETCGDFTRQVPTQDQIRALVRLVGTWAKDFGIHSVIGHEDVVKIVPSVNGLSTATACPGNFLYLRIPEICYYVNKEFGIQLKNPYEHYYEIVDTISSQIEDDSKLPEQGLYHD